MMSNQDNLLERMAEVIVREGRTANSAAQAIIDGFGLRWEHQPVIGGTRKRIIGDWKGGKEGTKK